MNPRCVVRLLLLLVALCPWSARADTVASLLGNFTVNQYCELRLAPSRVDVHFVVIFGQLPALRELHLADADGDGVTTQEERDAYVATLAPGYARDLVLTVDGAPIALHATHWKTSLPTEQGGFSMRLDIDYIGDLPVAAGALQFDNRNDAGRIGWHEIAVKSDGPLKVFDTNAYDDSLTNGLQDALQALPASGPLDERAIHLRFTDGPLPFGAKAIAGRGDKAAIVSASATPVDQGSDATGDWLVRQTRRLVEAISAPRVSPFVLIVALLSAVVLGALHAFSPGHGKTIVGAYLIGSRSTPRHAIFLGVTVTITHTLVVFAVGLATLVASRYILPERLFPLLSLLSGILVLGMGVVLLRQRWPTAHEALGRLLVRWYERHAAKTASPAASSAVPVATAPAFRPLPAARYGLTRATASHRHADHGHAHGHDHHHDHDHNHEHEHAHAHPHGSGMHSHGGGTLHSHLPPGAAGERVSWRSLLALGVSGGLVPCPSAMVLLLAAVALNKTAYGLLMVVAFSVGLAATLIAVGMVFLYARSRLGGRMTTSPWTAMLPAVSGVFITLVGLFLCYGAVTSAALTPFRS